MLINLNLRDKGWNMQELIDEGYLKPEVKQFETLSELLNHEALSKNEKLITKIPYINRVLINGMDTTKNQELNTIQYIK